MIIAFGTGLFLGDNTNEYTYEIQSVTGLESPAVRNGNGLYSGEDGGYWISQYFGHRTVVINGFSIIKCASDIQRARKYLIDRLPIRYVCPIVIQDFNDDCWYLEGCVTDIKMDLNKIGVIEYQITVTCADPLIYTANTITDFQPQKNEYPIELNGEASILFVPQGALYAWSTIEVTGIYTTPLTISDTTTGEFITIDNTTTEATDKTRIDIKNRIVTLNGVTINNKLSIDSTWFKLVQGNNRITATSGDSVNDTATAQIEYLVGFRGI